MKQHNNGKSKDYKSRREEASYEEDTPVVSPVVKFVLYLYPFLATTFALLYLTGAWDPANDGWDIFMGQGIFWVAVLQWILVALLP